jgi:transcription elongation factor GreA
MEDRMEDRPVLLTKDGLRQLEEELDQLVRVRRGEVAERIRQARDFGDISENAEYTEAKNEQSLVEGRIQTLEAMIRNAVLIEDAPREPGVVGVGAKVTVDAGDGEESYAIVGAAEADPLKGRISNESPLGRALMGHRAGEEVEWTSPSGTSMVRILAVS